MNKPDQQQVCIDSNIIVRTLVPGPNSEIASSLLEYSIQQDLNIIAPAQLIFEVSSAIRYYTYQEELTKNEGKEKIQAFLELDIQYSRSKEMIKRAWSFAEKYDQPNIYDSAYLALSERRGCDFWTGDQAFYNAVGDQIEFVYLLTEFSEG